MVRAIALMLVLLPAFAHAADTASVEASVTIVAPIMVRAVQGLDFGRVAAGTDSGSVVVSPDGSRTTVGGVTSQGSEYGAARFTVTGTDGTAFSISLPTSCVLSRSGGAETLVVDHFTSAPAGKGFLAPAGTTLCLGAELHVAASQAVGTYLGRFNVTVSYQ